MRAGLLLKMQMLNLRTDFGDFDLSFRPAGFSGFDDLVPNAVEVAIAGVAVPVASLDDVIHSKESANRPKDQAALPQLYALRDEIARSDRRPPLSFLITSSRALVDLDRGTHARLDRALDPRVRERRVLAGEVDSSFGRDDPVVQQRLLLRVEEGERPARELVVVPHLRSADLELVGRLGMDPRDVLERLHDAVLGREGAPPLRVLTPRVAREHHAAAGVAPVVRVVDVADREVADRSTTGDPVVVLPEPPTELEEHLRRGVVVELADRALLEPRERREHLDVAQHRERHRHDEVVAA